MKAIYSCKIFIEGWERLQYVIKRCNELYIDTTDVCRTPVNKGPFYMIITPLGESFKAVFTDNQNFNKCDYKEITSLDFIDKYSLYDGRNPYDLVEGKIYFVKETKGPNTRDDEYWLFRYRENFDMISPGNTICKCYECMSVYKGVMDYSCYTPGIVMADREIYEIREATPDEKEMYYRCLKVYEFKRV
jgi:hypothetical protein